ncbi:hypothetical protein Q5P01_006804 [Channa striata]|uniref:Uncharacterized protein n=1 Tax=Channa striata TaxID=64152 RepID=A0AA88NDU1_CHASR|nr:hypothetical protein Q5P01_006804 [Channa striata]
MKWVVHRVSSPLNPICPADVAQHMLTCSHSLPQRQRRRTRARRKAEQRRREGSPVNHKCPVQPGEAVAACSLPCYNPI